LKPYPYDPAKARALLQSAGAIGKTIDLETASDYAGGRQLVESVASYWEAVGLKVNIVISPHASFIGDIFNIPSIGGQSSLVSIGDLLMAAGVAWLIIRCSQRLPDLQPAYGSSPSQ